VDMEPIVNRIADVAGVSGAAIFGDTGTCLAHRLPPPYDPILLWEMLRGLRSATECCAGAGLEGQPNDTLLVFEEGKVVTRRAEPYELVALTSNQANLAVLGVAFNVATLRLAQRPEPQSVSAPAPAARTPSLSESTRMAQGPSYGGPPGVPMSPMPNVGSGPLGRVPAYPPEGYGPMSWSQSDTSRRAGGAVGLKVMRHLLSVTQRHLGPNGRSVLEQELQNLGATPQTLTSAHFADLIRNVARLVDPAHRETYLAEVLGDRRR